MSSVSHPKVRASSASRRACVLAFLSALLILAVLAPGAALADGMIYVEDVRLLPRRPIPSPRPHFPLEVTRHRVTIEIDETLARTRVEETFWNPNEVQLEGTYLFPLPPGAAVSGFSMKMGGQEVSGEILEKDKARQIYEDIVRRARDPGLLEYVDRGLFRARVFPIPARGGVEIALEYSEALSRDHGAATYRYPLDTGKYSTGDYKDVVVDLRLRSSSPVRSIHCPSHEAALISRASDKEARVSFEAKTLRADRDFVVAWAVGEDALAPVLLACRGTEPEGYFLFSIAPRPTKPETAPPKDVVFVIDTSGSMMGSKIDQVKKALVYGVGTLNPQDRFNIVDFSTESRRFRDGLVEASAPEKALALTYVEGLKARGGTNIEEALRLGLSNLKTVERLGVLVFLTDGEPTIGLTSPAEILKSVDASNRDRRRIFVFGVGEDLNAKLLDSVAKESRGRVAYLGIREDLEVPLSNFFDKIDFPVLTDISIAIAGVEDLYPRPLPDLFRGDQLDVFGRYRADGERAIVLRGKLQGEERVFEYAMPFTAGPHAFIPRLWASRKIGYLLEQMRLGGETGEVKDEVIRLSKLHGIITPYTSYLILEEDRQLTRLASAPSAAPAPLAAARDALGGGGPPSTSAEPAGEGGAVRSEARRAAKGFDSDRGADGVELSKKLGELKAGRGGGEVREFLDRSVNVRGERVREVGSRTFYLQGKRWVDSALASAKAPEGDALRKVKYLSDAYFALLSEEPGIGLFLSLGEEVTFAWKDKVIVVEG